MAAKNGAELAVIGHGCADFFLGIPPGIGGDLNVIFRAGKVRHLKRTRIGLGGALKTGVTTHNLGIPTILVGPVGDEPFGASLRQHIESIDPQLAEGLFVCPGGMTAHSFVIQPEGLDRAFGHHPGVVDLMTEGNIPWDNVEGVSWAHYGYLTLMEGMWENNGAEAKKMFARLKQMGIVTSMDVTVLDPNSEAGQQDWPAIMAEVLPYVDVFMPSESDIQPLGLAKLTGPAGASNIAKKILDLGSAIVVFKLGEKGIYVRVTDDLERLRCFGQQIFGGITKAHGYEFVVPSFEVKELDTTGSGDRAIGGFIASALKGQPIQWAAKTAAASGACSVSQPNRDEIDPDWLTLHHMMDAWNQPPDRFSSAFESLGFDWSSRYRLWLGSNDPRRK